MKVIYVSNTGFTERYAKHLAKTLGCEALSLKDALSCVRKKSNVIYFGWVNAGKIEGLRKARKHFNPICVCGVGISPYVDKTVIDLMDANDLHHLPFFYLQGGFDYSRLKGFNKLKMSIARSILRKSIEKKEIPDENEKALLDVLDNGKDFVDVNKIKSIADWFYSRYMI